MIDQPPSPPLTRDDRDELAAIAATASRRNRPSHLVLASAVLFLGSLAMAGSAFLSRGVAQRSLTSATAENVRATALIQRIDAIRAESAGTPGENAPIGIYDPIDNILSRLIELGGQAGITVGTPVEPPPRTVGAFVRREYKYTTTCNSIDSLFSWVRLVTDQIPGMQVISLSLIPQPASRSWTVNLTFARLERARR